MAKAGAASGSRFVVVSVAPLIFHICASLVRAAARAGGSAPRGRMDEGKPHF